jgi:hypothetical protein
MDKKGQVNGILVVLIMAGLLIGIVVLYYLYALAMPLFTGISAEAIGIVNEVGGTSNADEANITEAITTVTTPISSSMHILSWFGYLIFIGLLIAFLIIAFNIRTHPYLSVFWILIIVALVITSMFMANSYEELKQDSYLAGQYNANPTNDFIILHLPHIVSAFGLISGLILFILVTRDPEMEGSVI